MIPVPSYEQNADAVAETARSDRCAGRRIDAKVRARSLSLLTSNAPRRPGQAVPLRPLSPVRSHIRADDAAAGQILPPMGVGAAGRRIGQAVDRLGPLGRVPLRPVARTARQLGRNPYSPPNTAQ